MAPALSGSFCNKGDRRIVHTPDYNSNKNQIGLSAVIKVYSTSNAVGHQRSRTEIGFTWRHVGRVREERGVCAGPWGTVEH